MQSPVPGTTEETNVTQASSGPHAGLLSTQASSLGLPIPCAAFLPQEMPQLPELGAFSWQRAPGGCEGDFCVQTMEAGLVVPQGASASR